jgi:hypothetical protein
MLIAVVAAMCAPFVGVLRTRRKTIALSSGNPVPNAQGMDELV